MCRGKRGGASERYMCYERAMQFNQDNRLWTIFDFIQFYQNLINNPWHIDRKSTSLRTEILDYLLFLILFIHCTIVQA